MAKKNDKTPDAPDTDPCDPTYRGLAPELPPNLIPYVEFLRENRWVLFTREEVEAIAGALHDSSGFRSDHRWYLSCLNLQTEIMQHRERCRRLQADSDL